MAKTKQVEAVAAALLELPIGAPPVAGYEDKQVHSGKVSLAPRRSRLHVQAQLGPEAATAFIRIRNGLREQNEKLSDGRPVWTNVDTLRWMMERVAEQIA
jgi:hypothetical protein